MRSVLAIFEMADRDRGFEMADRDRGFEMADRDRGSRWPTVTRVRDGRP
jgi:hypothetical protein